MKKRRRWGRPLLAAVTLAVAMAWGLYAGAQSWWLRREVARARAEIAAGRFGPARHRLAALAKSHPGAMGGTVDYLMGICEASAGRGEAALAAFARVPEGFEFTVDGAFLEARANIERGRLRPAEDRLEAILKKGGADLERPFSLLMYVYETQVRFDDVRRMLRERLGAERGAHRITRLRDLENVNLGNHPYDRLRAMLDQYGRRAPGDDRVWLGRGRLAIVAGRWDEAAAWLRRCLEARADAPVWRAWLDWAHGAGRPDEAQRALEHLGAGELEPSDRLAAVAWLHAQRDEPRAEREVLERGLRSDPASPRVLERMAELAQRAGETESAAGFRGRKADVDRAMERYRRLLWVEGPIDKASDRLELARTAETAGYRAEARAAYTLVAESDPDNRPAREALARLDRVAAELSLAAVAPLPPRTAPGKATRTRHAARKTAPVIIPTFTDDAEAVGLRFTYDNGASPIRQLPEVSGGGVAMLDYDGDGRLDVYCVQGGAFPPRPDRPPAGDRLYRNKGDGTFEDVTQPAGIAAMPRGYGHGVTTGDYDGDGDPDLFITRWRGYALYRNNGDGTFSDVTEPAGLGGARGWPTSAAMADLDGDGDLDLYVVHYVAWDAEDPRLCHDQVTGAYITCNPHELRSEPDHLFRNDGGRFVDVTAVAGIVDSDGRGLGVVAADLDEDGKLDLFVANDTTANSLFRNLGGMRFEEVGHLAGVASNARGGYQAGMGIAAGDLDGDGRIDLAVTNFFGESTTFYRNLGGGLFADDTVAIGLAAPSRELLGFGVALFDANDDGWLDLASANGHVNDLRPNYPYRMPAQLMLGGPEGRLTDVSRRAGVPWREPRMGRGLAVGDLDNDGRQDVLILSHNQPLAYLHNRTEGGRSLTLLLDGRGPNRDAIGARVVVVAGGRRRVAWRTGGGSFQSASDPRLHFGLDGAARAESVEVTWPTGHVDRYAALDAGGYLLREGQAAPEPKSGFAQGVDRHHRPRSNLQQPEGGEDGGKRAH